MAKAATAKVIEIGGSSPTSGGDQAIEFQQPYTALVTIEGVADLIMHRWNPEGVDAKAAAAKGSRAKKTDDVESYVYRNEAGEICIPGSYLQGSLVAAAKFRQDPRSPRKSMMDLAKAGVIVLTALATLGKKEWDYEDRRRVVVQRNGINRTRPAMRVGWRAEFEILVTLPEYIPPQALNELVAQAGRLIGIADHRPTYGRYQLISFSVREP